MAEISQERGEEVREEAQGEVQEAQEETHRTLIRQIKERTTGFPEMTS